MSVSHLLVNSCQHYEGYAGSDVSRFYRTVIMKAKALYLSKC
jgi:hypothetical protein